MKENAEGQGAARNLRQLPVVDSARGIGGQRRVLVRVQGGSILGVFPSANNALF